MSKPISDAPPELTVVMPVHNEERAIEAAVREVVMALERLDIRFEIRLYDDGSTDATLRRLEALAAEDGRIVVASHANRGHGPTVVRGYLEATAPWIFQIDSDNEIAPEQFVSMWSERDSADLHLGVRQTRSATAGRRILTAGARAAVRMCFGRRLSDVNCPFRLMRAAAFERLIPLVPLDCFAPNVVLSGLALGSGLRVVEVPVTFRPTPGRVARAGSRRLLWGGLRSAFDCWRLRRVAAGSATGRRMGGTSDSTPDSR